MCLSYQTVLVRLACKFQYLNVSQIKIPVKIVTKVLSLDINRQIRRGNQRCSEVNCTLC